MGESFSEWNKPKQDSHSGVVKTEWRRQIATPHIWIAYLGLALAFVASSASLGLLFSFLLGLPFVAMMGIVKLTYFVVIKLDRWLSYRTYYEAKLESKLAAQEALELGAEAKVESRLAVQEVLELGEAETEAAAAVKAQSAGVWQLKQTLQCNLPDAKVLHEALMQSISLTDWMNKIDAWESDEHDESSIKKAREELKRIVREKIAGEDDKEQGIRVVIGWLRDVSYFAAITNKEGKVLLSGFRCAHGPLR